MQYRQIDIIQIIYGNFYGPYLRYSVMTYSIWIILCFQQYYFILDATYSSTIDHAQEVCFFKGVCTMSIF